MSSVLELKGLYKSMGGTEILHGVDLTLDKGEVLAVLGPSGSGKTTLLRCLNFLEKADSGQVIMLGRTINMPSAGRREIAEYRRHTAFVFQNFNLFANKTALENVTEGLIVARGLAKPEAEQIGMKALGKVGLADKADSYPSRLSGGQQQRVAIARAIAAGPDVIMLDEPTSALDPELIGEVLHVIKQLADDGMTMIIVTHEIGFARSVADRILFMDGGNVVVQTGTKDFFEKNDNKRVREFLGSLSERIGLNEHDTQNQKNDSASHSNSASHGKRGRVRKKGGRK